MAETVIKINNLKKEYRLGAIGGGTLRADLQSWWARRKGIVDPNTKIGEETRLIGERFLALNNINLEVKQGEALGVIGANGAGKSTLLKLLSRITAPTEGTIHINGRIASMLEVGTGFHGELTGRENIYMNGAILGMTRKEVDKKIEDIIDFSDCRQFIDTPVKRYSSGMYVKLAFSVAAHLDAEIMVMDEVLAVGDMKFQEKCLSKMGDAAGQEGKTVLYVSHNMNTIKQLCTRCIVLDKGEIVYDGDVDTAISVYMDREKGELVSFYDFDKVKRPSIEHGANLWVHSFEFLDKEKAIYSTSEKMRFRVTWTSKIDINDIRLYFAINYVDSSIVGTSQSMSLGNVVSETKQSIDLEFDISNLVEGMYYFYVDVFSMNEYGTHFSYDHPLKKVYFEIMKDDELISINWIRRAWGSIRLNEMKLINSKEN